MKRLIALILVAVMMLSFVACKATNDDVKGEVSTSDKESVKDQETDKDSKDESDKDEAPEFSMGDTASGKYVNKFLGFECTLNGDWEFYSEDQIKALNNVTADLAGEEYEAIMAEANVLTDMYAVHSNGLDSINVNLEKVGLVGAAAYDAEKSFDESAKILKSSFENMGYENVSSEIVKVNFAGKEHIALRTTASIAGINMYQVIVSEVRGAYVSNITVTTFYNDTTQSLIGCFAKIK